MKRTTSYIVASTPRTGSYLLCEGLEATCIAGRPTEVFSPDFQHIWRQRWGLSADCTFVEYLKGALAHGTTANGVYGLKIHWMHIKQLAGAARFSEEPSAVLQHLFGDTLFVNIVRRDRRAQALSYFRALATNEWWRIKGVVNDQINGTPPIFSADSVRSLEQELAEQQLSWERLFLKRRIKPLVVEYEALVSDYKGEVGRVLDFIGIDPAIARSIPAPRLQRQSDDLNELWTRLMKD